MAELLNLLKKEHQKVKNILEDLEDASPYAIVKCRDLLMQLKEELQLHEAIEKKVFSPNLMALKISKERSFVEELIKKLEANDFTHTNWFTKLAVLKNNILELIETEEHEISPQIIGFSRQEKLQFIN